MNYWQGVIETVAEKLGCVGVNARKVEAFMMLENRTLDGLSPYEIRECIKSAIKMTGIEVQS
jgi:hypothetical protein